MYKNSFLNDRSFEFPYEGNLNNSKLSKIVKVATQLSAGLSTINQGGCGIFASMLDSIFNGEIVQLRLIRREYLYEEGRYASDFHEIFVKDGFCYDAYNVCSKRSLLKMKKIDSIITMEKLNYLTKPNKFFLIKRNCQRIIFDYQEDNYNPFFANRRKMTILFLNYVKVLNSLPKGVKSGINHEKVDTILNSYNPIMERLAA